MYSNKVKSHGRNEFRNVIKLYLNQDKKRMVRLFSALCFIRQYKPRFILEPPSRFITQKGRPEYESNDSRVPHDEQSELLMKVADV